MAGRPRKEVKLEQAAALVAMTNQGLSRKDAGRVLGLTKAKVDEVLDGAKLELAARAREYVDLHLQAARVAAEKGKAEPSQWMLERTGVVSSAPAPQPGQQGGTKIIIGINLPGLAPDAARDVIVASATPVVDAE